MGACICHLRLSMKLSPLKPNLHGGRNKSLQATSALFGAPFMDCRRLATYFTPRQLVALTTFSDLVNDARERAMQAAQSVYFPSDKLGIEAGGYGAYAYADAVATCWGWE